MSEKDAAKEDADKFGGWENYARGLHELYTSGKDKLLRDAYQRTKEEKFSSVFDDGVAPTRRGAKTKRDFGWFNMVETILRGAIRAAGLVNEYHQNANTSK